MTKKLCPRTLCIFDRGVTKPGFYCAFRFNGSVPNTGRLVCNTCGGEPEPDERVTRAITGGRCNDLIVWNGGSLYMVRPVTEAGREWLKETAPEEAQFLGESMAVEHRYIADVVNAAREAGLEVA